MTLAPRVLVSFWAGILAARQARKMKSPGRGGPAQEITFRQLVTRIETTEYGRQNGVESIMTQERFRERVPPVTLHQLQPLIARMARGEAGVLWPGRCPLFAATAGTTGDPQRLPVTAEMLQHFRTGLLAAALGYANRAGDSGVFLGRHLHVGASTAVMATGETQLASLDGILALSLSPWAEANLYAPPPALARLPENNDKFRAIAAAMSGCDVTLIAGTPAAVLATADFARLAAGRGQPRLPALQAIWPNLECCLHTGAPLGLFGDELRASFSPEVRLHELYAAAEGVIAVQENDTGGGLRLLTDAGLYFEFLPASDYHPAQLPRLGPRLVPLTGVTPGVDYVLFVTTPAGLCRCSTGDIVRFDSVDPPRLTVVGRTALQLDPAGERVGVRELTDSLLAVCADNGWQPVDFHVAPYFIHNANGLARSCHEWWVELRPLSVKTPTGPVLAPLLDEALAARSATYAARRQSRALEAPVVRLVIPGVFDEWARGRNFGVRPSKMPRCRPDRSLADQLANLTRFHNATPAPLAHRPRPGAPTSNVIASDTNDTENPLGISREKFH